MDVGVSLCVHPRLSVVAWILLFITLHTFLFWIAAQNHAAMTCLSLHTSSFSLHTFTYDSQHYHHHL